MKERQRTGLVLISLAGLVLLAGYVAAFHAVFTSQQAGANDFFPSWAGARLFITRGWNPYGEQASQWIQDVTFGDTHPPWRETWVFYYPFYTLFAVMPLALIADYAWAQAIWQVACQAFVVAGVLLAVRYQRWQPGMVLLGILLVWALTFYHVTRAILLGQMALLVFVLTVGAFWLLLRAPPRGKAEIAAGALLALSTVKPQMQYLIIPFLVLYALRERRWTFIAAFGVSMAVLVGVSFVLLPSWLADWLGVLRLYPGHTPPSVLHILTREVIPLGAAAPTVEWGLAGLLIGYLLVEWWRVLVRREDQRLDWVLGLTLVVTHLAAPRTATTHYAVLLFPLAALLRDWARTHWAIAVAAMLALSAGLWALFLSTVAGIQEANVMFVPLPVLVFVLVVIFQPRAHRARAAV